MSEAFVNAPGYPSLLVPVGVFALIAWRFYSRVRRMIGRQHLSRVRPWITVCLFPLLAVLLASASIARPLSLLALASGAVLGVVLGLYGLRLTRFEQTPAGLFYTPSAHLGIALSALLLARVMYRGMQVYMASESGGGPPVDYARTPLTLLIFGTLAGYYVTYAIGLLRWGRNSSMKS